MRPGRYVSAERARSHLQAMRRLGVGNVSAAEVTGMTPLAILRIATGQRTQIRASSEARILAIDEGALADGGRTANTRTMDAIAELKAMGFTLRELKVVVPLPCIKNLRRRSHVRLKTQSRLEKFLAKARRGEVESRQRQTEKAYAFLDRLVNETGVTQIWLCKRLGISVHSLCPYARRRRMYPSTLACVHGLQRELEQAKREGTGRPDGWEYASAGGLASAFGFDGGWSAEQRTSKKAKQREARELRALARAKRRPPQAARHSNPRGEGARSTAASAARHDICRAAAQTSHLSEG